MVFKVLCLALTGKKHENITNYRKTMLSYDPNFNMHSREIANLQFTVTPFREWNPQNGDNPEWWRAYTAIKHERSHSFYRATLKHAILALASLQIVLFEYYKIDTKNEYLKFDYKDSPSLVLPKLQGSSLEKQGVFLKYL